MGLTLGWVACKCLLLVFGQVNHFSMQSAQDQLSLPSLQGR